METMKCDRNVMKIVNNSQLEAIKCSLWPETHVACAYCSNKLTGCEMSFAGMQAVTQVLVSR